MQKKEDSWVREELGMSNADTHERQALYAIEHCMGGICCAALAYELHKRVEILRTK